ncbi:acetyl-CoA C-acetyltransferase [Rhodobacteraceae bacterium D3-12]|nr:acetyl-CoA C-acetyltransferase [Rhodobacteraceae bacterium D3-12]
MAEAFIVDHCRTPRGIGRIGKGALSTMHPQELGASVLRALKDRNDLPTEKVDDIIWGCSNQQNLQGNDLGRMTALAAGYDVRASGVTLDRFCGSALTAVNFGAATIMSGMEEIVVSGGAEMMSFNYGNPKAARTKLFDSENLNLRQLHPQVAQGICADAIATLEGISRRATEELAVESQRRAAAAIRGGHFAGSTITVRDADGTVLLEHEEYPRPDTSLEKLAGLKPVFEAIAHSPVDENGTTQLDLIHKAYPGLDIDFIHHAGTSSGVVDGAAALLLASQTACIEHGLKPRARIVAMANVGDSPELMLNGPVPAAQKVLAKANMTLEQIDLIEINEAFAVVAEKFIRDLRLDRDKVNVNGGAIALGHPIGATGAMLIGTLLDELERRDLKTGLVTMCAAGGMAPAIIIERV